MKTQRSVVLLIRNIINKYGIIILASVFSLVVYSCSKEDPISPGNEDPAPSKLVELTAIIDSIINHNVTTNDPSIAIAVTYNGILKHSKAYGKANLEQNLNADANTPYFLCSISKTFTSILTLICQERGLLNVEDKIGDYFPSFPEEWSEITIHHLLTHQSGIPDFINDLNYIPEGISNEEAIDYVLENSTLNFEPGSGWKYCNTGYTILAQLVQKVSGKKFETFAKENIFDPLGMANTSYYGEDAPNISNRAIGYESDGSISDYTLRTVGSTGVISTLNDMLKWDKALYGEEILSKELLELAWFEHTEAAISDHYGYGFSLGTVSGHKVVFHTGGFGGFRNLFIQVHDEEYSLILLSNGSYNKLIFDIKDRVLDFYFSQ